DHRPPPRGQGRVVARVEGVEGVTQQGGPVDHERTLVGARAAAPREAPQPLHRRMSCADEVGHRCTTVHAEAGVASALSSSAAFALATRALNAALSVTARSASTLRSTSMPASRRPATNRL